MFRGAYSARACIMHTTMMTMTKTMSWSWSSLITLHNDVIYIATITVGGTALALEGSAASGVYKARLAAAETALPDARCKTCAELGC